MIAPPKTEVEWFRHIKDLPADDVKQTFCDVPRSEKELLVSVLGKSEEASKEPAASRANAKEVQNNLEEGGR